MDEKVKNMRDIPVYPYPAAYARFAGELDQFRESKKANQECGKAIDAVIDAAWDGLRLPPDAGPALMERFGRERLGYVLADRIQQRSGDGVFRKKPAVGAELSHARLNGNPLGTRTEKPFREAGWADYTTAA